MNSIIWTMQHSGTIRRGLYRAAAALEPPHRLVAVEQYDQPITELTGALEHRDVTRVKQIEASAGCHELGRRAGASTSSRRHAPVSGVHQPQCAACGDVARCLLDGRLDCLRHHRA